MGQPQKISSRAVTILSREQKTEMCRINGHLGFLVRKDDLEFSLDDFQIRVYNLKCGYPFPSP